MHSASPPPPNPARWVPLPLPDVVSAIAADDARLAVALVDGRVLHSYDGGGTWTPIASDALGLPTALLPVRGTLLVGTAAGVVRVGEADGGRPGLGVPSSVVVTALAARGAATIAGTLRAGVYRSEDGGLRWEAARQGLPLDGARLRVSAATSALQGFVVAHALGMSWSGDGGRTWMPAGTGLPLQMPRATLAPDGPALYAGIGGRLYRTAPAEGDLPMWTEMYDGPGDGRPLDLLGSDAGILYAASPMPPHLVASTDGGTTWHSVASGFPGIPTGFAVGPAWIFGMAAGSLWRTARPHPPPRPAPSADLALDVQATRAADPLLLSFTLDVPSTVRITIQDLLDREVACLTVGRYGPGTHDVRLAPGTLPPGLYRCRLRAGSRSRSAPFALLG